LSRAKEQIKVTLELAPNIDAVDSTFHTHSVDRPMETTNPNMRNLSSQTRQTKRTTTGKTHESGIPRQQAENQNTIDVFGN